jgi:hypothetical protein
MELRGILQSSNNVSVSRKDKKLLRSRILLDEYEVNTWVGIDGTLKVEISKRTPRGTIGRVVIEDTLQNMIEGN